MGIFRDCVSDAGLHILAALVVLIYLAQGAGPARDLSASSRLLTCPSCRAHHFPERPHACPGRWGVAPAGR